MNPNFSPADSLLSAPSDYSQSLFGHDGTITPADMALTPQSIKMESDCAGATPTPSPEEQGDEKRPAKKRKSWGQELPTPKTNLPPRKRAKTEDEKEQRRIERVLRNRAAAQSSRERKRQEVEKLEIEKVKIEKENQLLAHRLRQAETDRFHLEEKVARMEAEMAAFRKILQGDAGAVEIRPKASSPTLSADLLSRPEEPVPNLKHEIEELDMILAPQGTVDPRTSLSSASSPEPTATTPGMTQHPAEMLCDLQCQPGVNRLPWDSMTEAHRQQTIFNYILATFNQILWLSMISATSSIIHPLGQVFLCLKTGCPLNLSSTANNSRLFPLILWLISTPTNPLLSTTTSKHSAQPTFRINLLRRLLACSPALARPLLEVATGRELQPRSSGEKSKGWHADVDRSALEVWEMIIARATLDSGAAEVGMSGFAQGGLLFSKINEAGIGSGSVNPSSRRWESDFTSVLSEKQV